MAPPVMSGFNQARAVGVARRVGWLGISSPRECERAQGNKKTIEPALHRPLFPIIIYLAYLETRPPGPNQLPAIVQNLLETVLEAFAAILRII
jgi:hypothetical protein